MSEMQADANAGRSSGGMSETLRETLHAKEALCNELNALAEQTGIADYAGAIADLCARYAASGSVPPEYAEVLDKKFSEALENAKRGADRFEAKKQQLAKFAAEVDSLIAADDLATLREVETLEKRLADAAADPELAAKLAPLKAKLQADAAASAAAEAAALKLAEELTALTAAEDITALHDRKQEIEKAFAELAGIPRPAAQRYQEAHRKASVRLAQHYETLDLARWESYTLKLDLCKELETLNAVSEAELGKASKALNEIREKWKKLGSVPKEKNEEINPRYLELTRSLQHRIDEYYACKRQEQKISAAEKIKLCEEAESLADSTDWGKTAGRLREMQSQWKSLPRAGAQESALFGRFHAAADKFFTARKENFAEREKVFAAAEARKRALISEAQNMTDVRRAKQLRDEYRAVGYAGKKDQELYQEFNGAMDRFFSDRREANAEKEKQARALVAEIEQLTAAPEAGRERIKAIREELHTLSCRETRAAEQEALRKFEAASEKAHAQAEAQKIAVSGDVTRTLAECYSAFLRGEKPEVPAAEQFAGFAKLQSAAQLLAAALAGEDKAAEKLEKQVVSARAEREKICAELEKLSGSGKEEAKPLTLAEELEAAITGNFAKAEARSAHRPADPRKLIADFAACGVVPAEELAAFQTRLDQACAVIFPEK